MKQLLKWGALALGALVALSALVGLVFWATVPPLPDVGAEAAPPPDSSVSAPELRAELLRRLALDQAVRESGFGEGTPDLSSLGGIWDLLQQGVRMRRVDGPNTAWLKATVAERGWPTRAEVGADGRRAVFLLVQHADHDLGFQREALGPMREAVEAGDARGSDLAYLTDRVRKAEGRPQLYGTQLHMNAGQDAFLWPVEDAEAVDARRAALGMPPLAEYLARACEEGGMCVEWPAPEAGE